MSAALGSMAAARRGGANNRRRSPVRGRQQLRVWRFWCNKCCKGSGRGSPAAIEDERGVVKEEDEEGKARRVDLGVW
jgi:hypothetical protein